MTQVCLALRNSCSGVGFSIVVNKHDWVLWKLFNVWNSFGVCRMLRDVCYLPTSLSCLTTGFALMSLCCLASLVFLLTFLSCLSTVFHFMILCWYSLNFILCIESGIAFFNIGTPPRWEEKLGRRDDASTSGVVSFWSFLPLCPGSAL